MKFKAFLTDNGVNLLEKRFLPALDKMGRICHLYLSRDHAIFLHNLLNGDGVQSIAQFRKETLFEDYRISSQNDDRIAFSLDLALLHRALRSSVSICIEGGAANRLQIKLVKKLPPNSRQPTPFLTFETKGYKSAVIQDVPISKPLSRADVMELQSALDMAQDLPQTLVQVPDLVQLQSFVDRLKHVGDLLNISITQYGDLHLQVSTTLITVGSEFRKLRVLGVQAEVPAGDPDMSAQSRTEMAIQRGEALSVQVSMKHFAKSLQCHLAKPDCAFYGIAPQGTCLTVIFQFFIPGCYRAGCEDVYKDTLQNSRQEQRTDKTLHFAFLENILQTGKPQKKSPSLHRAWSEHEAAEKSKTSPLIRTSVLENDEDVLLSSR